MRFVLPHDYEVVATLRPESQCRASYFLFFLRHRPMSNRAALERNTRRETSVRLCAFSLVCRRAIEPLRRQWRRRVDSLSWRAHGLSIDGLWWEFVPWREERATVRSSVSHEPSASTLLLLFWPRGACAHHAHPLPPALRRSQTVAVLV